MVSKMFFVYTVNNQVVNFIRRLEILDKGYSIKLATAWEE